MKVQIVAQTNVGRIRDHNEDNFHIIHDLGIDKTYDKVFELQNFGSVLIVADGMGGEAAGEVASKIATISIAEYLKEKITDKDLSHLKIIEILKDSLIFAHERIIEYVKDNSDSFGMGTTAIVGLIYDNSLFIAWVGDSRAYRFSKEGKITSHNYFSGNLEILTNDHSLVWGEVIKGKMTPEQARTARNSNIITQSLGDIYKKPIPESNIFPLFQDDIVLLCSDGLNGMVSDDELDKVFNENKDLNTLCEVLINTANNNGGNDNITVALCKIVEGDIFQTNEGLETKDIDKPRSNVSYNSAPINDKSELKSFGIIAAFLLFAFLTVIYFSKNKIPNDESSITKTSKQPVGVILDSLETKSNDIDTNNLDTISNLGIDGTNFNSDTTKKITKRKTTRPGKAKTTANNDDTNTSKRKSTSKLISTPQKIGKKEDVISPAMPSTDSIKLKGEKSPLTINRKQVLVDLFKTLPKNIKDKDLRKEYKRIKKSIIKLSKTDTAKIRIIKKEIYDLFKKLDKK